MADGVYLSCIHRCSFEFLVALLLFNNALLIYYLKSLSFVQISKTKKFFGRQQAELKAKNISFCIIEFLHIFNVGKPQIWGKLKTDMNFKIRPSGTSKDKISVEVDQTLFKIFELETDIDVWS